MREEDASPDVLVAKLAHRQHGVVAGWQLRACGLSTSAISRRVSGGRLHRIHQGVYAVGHRPTAVQSAWMAAVIACGSAAREARDDLADEGIKRIDGSAATIAVLDYWGAALSHRSAAELWRLLPGRGGPVDVSIRGDRGRARRRGIRLHRSQLLLPAAVTSLTGIPVTSPAKTIADLRLAAVGRTPLVTPRALRRAIRQANFLGLPIDEEAESERCRSDFELDFLALCRRFSLPPPEVNVRVGPHLVDFYWRRQRLAVETDGYAAHRGRAAFEDDRGRDLDLRARGEQVIHIAEKQLDEEPQRVAEVVGAALRVGADVPGCR